MRTLPRRILVPIDFGPASRRALTYARALASASHAEIGLLHVMPVATGRLAPTSEAWWIELAQRTLTGLVARAHLPAGTTTEVLSGPVISTVDAYAADNGFDLVVLTGRRTPDWHGSLLGPTATAILKHSRVPVLVVPCASPSVSADRKSA